ncbi:MAG TPA: hypothetical protein VNR68_06795 [Sphingomicrobium sp.]|nr:hypothetical protein [Sphingomicrobium sp.]
MTKFAFALAGAAALSLAACSSGDNQDAVNEAAVNQVNDNLDMMADNAAMDAANAEAQALGEQEQQLNQEPADNTQNPADADEQNVSGM